MQLTPLQLLLFSYCFLHLKSIAMPPTNAFEYAELNLLKQAMSLLYRGFS